MPYKDIEAKRAHEREYYARNATRKLKQKEYEARNRTPEQRRIAVKKWRNNNREAHNAIKRRYWEKHKDRLNEIRRETVDHKAAEERRRIRLAECPELKERRLTSQREYYRLNSDICKLKVTRYAEQHRDKTRQWSRITNSRRRTAEGSHTAAEWVARFNSYKGHCAYCWDDITIDECHKDHVLPLSRGGTDYICNVVPSCPTCNLRKGSKFRLPLLILPVV